MKKIVLESLQIRNLGGINSFDLILDGKDALVQAENGTGKTMLKTAFRWCLSGKDSKGDTDFGLRPLDSDNNPIKGLVASSVLTLAIDDIEHVYKREHHEKVSKDQSRSYTTKCWIDEVSMSITRYNDSIAKVLPEETYKLFTDPGHFFNDEKFHWSKRRDVLTLLPDKIESPKGFEELIARINGRDLADYKKIFYDLIHDPKTGYKKEREEINPRIDENQRNLKEWVEKKIDTSKIKANRHDLKNDLAAKELQRAELLENQAERQKKVDGVNAFKDALAERKRNLKTDTGPIKDLLDEKSTLLEGVAGKREAVTATENAIKLQEQKIAAAKNVGDVHLQQLAVIREEFTAIKENPPSEPITESVKVCPTCTTPEKDWPDSFKAGKKEKVEAELAEAKKEYHNKRQEKADLGNSKNAEIQKDREYIGGMNKGLEELKVQLGKDGIEFDDAETYRLQRFTQIDAQIAESPTIPPEKDDTCIGLDKQITEALAEIGAPVSDQLEQIEKDRKQYEEQIKNLDDLLRQSDTADEIQPRIDELKASELDLAQKRADAEKELNQVKSYERAECTLIEDAVNGLFEHVKFRLFKELLKKDENGEVQTVPCCDALLDGVPYSDMSGGEEIFVQVDVLNVLGKHYGIIMPLFLDNAESLTLDIETDCQVIMLEAKTNDLEDDDPDYNPDLPKDYYSELRVTTF